MSQRSLTLALALGTMVLGLSTLVMAGNPNGTVLYLPAIYDDEFFVINFTELPPGGEAAALANNTQTNFIYQSDEDPDFISVLDAIPGDGFNPLWEEVQITFVTIDPQQFFSDDEILAAAGAGEIMLDFTGELYTCSVVGHK